MDEHYANQNPGSLWSFMSTCMCLNSVLNAKLRKGSFPALVSAHLVSRIRRGKSVQENIHINSSLTRNFFAHDTFILFYVAVSVILWSTWWKRLISLIRDFAGRLLMGSIITSYLKKSFPVIISWFDDNLFFDLYVIPCSAHWSNSHNMHC